MMRAWLDESSVPGVPRIYVDHGNGPVIGVDEDDTYRGGEIPASAVELVTAASVVERIRGELRGLQVAWSPGARRAIEQVLDRAAGVER